MLHRSLKVYLCVLLSVTLTVPLYATNINDLKNKEKEIQNNSNEIQNQIDETEAEKTQVMKDVEVMDAEINKLTDELATINTELEDTNATLDATEIELADAEATRERQYEVLKERLVFMYENGDTGYLDVILAAEDFSDFLNRAEYMNIIAEYDKNMLTNLENTEALVTQKLDEISTKKMEIEVLLAQEERRMDALEDTLANKKDYIEKLETDQAGYEQQLAEWDRAEKEVQALIKKAEDDAKRAAEVAKKSRTAAATKNYYTGGKFLCPIQSSYRISDTFKIREVHPITGKREMHTGIDMACPTGTNIAAAESGVVIFSGVKGGYGNCVILDHGGGYTTLYGHCSKLLVSVGEEVARGETIARVGSTGLSTGPHLHFEVRVNGSAVNPDGYLK